MLKLRKALLEFNLIKLELHQERNFHELNYIKNFKFLIKDAKIRYFVEFKKLIMLQWMMFSMYLNFVKKFIKIC